MKIVVLGATGQTGQYLVNQALQQGHTVTAVARNPGKLSVHHDNLKVVEADIFSEDSLKPHFSGQDVVMSCLGFPPSFFSPVTGYSRSMNSVVGAMREARVNRIITMTSCQLGGAVPLSHPLPSAADDPKRSHQHARDGAVSAEDRGHQLDRGSSPRSQEPAGLSSRVPDPRGILCARRQRQCGGAGRRGSLHALSAQHQRLGQEGSRHHHQMRKKESLLALINSLFTQSTQRIESQISGIQPFFYTCFIGVTRRPFDIFAYCPYFFIYSHCACQPAGRCFQSPSSDGSTVDHLTEMQKHRGPKGVSL
uniref:NAD(P)-binding domain-containing protein n=1 Tax=Gasterosteus aculeatus aculeatus TaxID=481459 RepID=A0AAQ4P188_GASAC